MGNAEYRCCGRNIWVRAWGTKRRELDGTHYRHNNLAQSEHSQPALIDCMISGDGLAGEQHRAAKKDDALVRKPTSDLTKGIKRVELMMQDQGLS